nr:isoform 2 of cysteine-rich receptor-like protein kinase 10 [Quercus suber]
MIWLQLKPRQTTSQIITSWVVVALVRFSSAFGQSDTAEDLLSYAWKHWSNGSYLDVLDSDMRDSCSRNEVIQCIHIGLLCVQENPADRPSMATIILMLNSGSVTLPSPQKPPFFLIVEQSRTCQQ